MIIHLIETESIKMTFMKQSNATKCYFILSRFWIPTKNKHTNKRHLCQLVFFLSDNQQHLKNTKKVKKKKSNI